MVVFRTVQLKYEADYKENRNEDRPKRRDPETHPDVTATVKRWPWQSWRKQGDMRDVCRWTDNGERARTSSRKLLGAYWLC